MQSIQDVIQALQKIVDTCYEHQLRHGYFAQLYLQMTQAVAQAITQNRFEDGKRMEALDVAFASRYIHAFDQLQKKQPSSACWNLAFNEGVRNSAIVLQHLMLGINAHINYDLAPAAALVARGDKIFALQHDFETINTIIETLADDVQVRLGKIWWPLPYLTRLTEGREKVVLDFSISKARKASWANAVALAMAQGSAFDSHLAVVDTLTAGVGQRIAKPGLLVRSTLKLVKNMEPVSVRKVMEQLR